MSSTFYPSIRIKRTTHPFPPPLPQPPPKRTEKRQIGSRAGNTFSTATFAVDETRFEGASEKDYWAKVGILGGGLLACLMEESFFISLNLYYDICDGVGEDFFLNDTLFV